MVQALTLNPVTELAEEPTAALPNPDAKKTPEKIKYKGENNFPSLPESGEER